MLLLVYGISHQIAQLFLNLNLNPQGEGSCQVIASDKSNLLRKVNFLLKSGFQLIVFLYSSR